MCSKFENQNETQFEQIRVQPCSVLIEEFLVENTYHTIFNKMYNVVMAIVMRVIKEFFRF